MGCTREDLSKCKVNLQIQHTYTLNPEYKDLFAQEVHQLAVYAFDQNERFYDMKFIADASQLGVANTMGFALPVGTYTLVTWAGEPTQYVLGEAPNGASTFAEGLRRGVTTLSDFRLWISHDLADTITVTQPADLFHGTLRNVQITDMEEVNNVTIGLVKNTHIIRVSITGLDAPNADTRTNTATVYATGSNSFYRHDNNLDLSAGEIKYLPHSEEQVGDYLISTLKVLRLMPSHRLMLTTKNKNTGQIYCNFDLLPYIMQSPDYQTQDELDREKQFDVEIKIDANLHIYIKINGWQFINVIPIMP
ncbi:MAG: FimB/Mfa2 family fimbrial subunit [Alistipes sp.]